ncbi:MAG: FAD-dependent thymidylate synthase [Candidatus Pacearchaeota archaeon]|jgi:thymidylate synthase ThyX
MFQTELDDKKIKVTLLGYTQFPNKVAISKKLGVDDFCVAGALGCFEEKSSYELLKEINRLPEKEREEKLEKICKETSGRGHGSVLDQGNFVFSIENLPRATTLFLCLPEYLSHLQQSLRRADANRGFYVPESIKKSPFNNEVFDAMSAAFEFYEEAKKAGVPAEDARYPLPLATRTNIQTLGNPRELMHLHHMASSESVPKINKEIVDSMIELASDVSPHIMKQRERSYEVRAWRPSSQLFAKENSLIQKLAIKSYMNNEYKKSRLIDSSSIPISEEEVKRAIEGDEAYLANLKHIHFTFLVPLSLNAFHQATRQRTWNQSVESIYRALEVNYIIVPPKVKEAGYEYKMNTVHNKLVNLANRLTVKGGIPYTDSILLAPHSLMIYDLIHVDGWNALHSIGKRTCNEAQWEIRDRANEIATKIRESGNPIGKYVYPQGVIYGVCPERKSCGLCERVIKERGD